MSRVFLRIAAAVFVADDREALTQSSSEFDSHVLHGFYFTTRSLRSLEHTEITEAENLELFLRDLRALCG